MKLQKTNKISFKNQLAMFFAMPLMFAANAFANTQTGTGISSIFTKFKSEYGPILDFIEATAYFGGVIFAVLAIAEIYKLAKQGQGKVMTAVIYVVVASLLFTLPSFIENLQGSGGAKKVTFEGRGTLKSLGK